eukprot:152691-Lingulodinium_polyedra.AAC.1
MRVGAPPLRPACHGSRSRECSGRRAACTCALPSPRAGRRSRGPALVTSICRVLRSASVAQSSR